MVSPLATSELLRAMEHLDEAEAALAAGGMRRARIGLTAATSLLAGRPEVPKAPLRRAVLACAVMRAEDGLIAWAIGLIEVRELRRRLEQLTS